MLNNPEDSNAPAPARALESLLVSLVVAITLLLLSPLNIPILGRDEGVFVYVGQQILRGKIPYRDVWDHKGPLIYYIDALGLFIGHHSQWGIWLIEGICITASLILLYLLLRRILSGTAATFGILTWLAGFTIVIGGNVVEEYAIILVVLAAYLAVYQPFFSAPLAGVLAGLAFMLRPNEAAAPALALVFLLGAQIRQRAWRSVSFSILQFLVGFLVVAGVTAAYFAWNHAINDFMRSVFLFNFYYVSAGGNFAASLLSGVTYLAVPVFFALASVVSMIVLRRPEQSAEQKRLIYFAAALFLITLPLSLLSGRSYRHYFVPWLFPLGILSAYFCFFLQASPMRAQVRNPLWITVWGLLTVATILGVRIRVTPLLATGSPPREQQAVLDIQRYVAPRQTLFIWGNETGYAVMAGRQLASRYIYLAPLLVPGYGELIAPQILADLQSHHPILIDTSPADADVPSLNRSTPPYPYLNDLYRFIHANYDPVGTAGADKWIVWAPR
jgi:4-amino-4-deoxy-L-arabinose transferase-like glycosyltransferase